MNLKESKIKRLIVREKEFMKTTITIKVVQENQGTVEINEAIQKAFERFDYVVKKFTRFNDDSELSNLNRQSGKKIKVSEEFFMLIQKMYEMYKKTNGAFDPSVIDFLEVYGYDKNYDFKKLDNPKLDQFVEDISKKKKSFSDVEMFERTSEVILPKNLRIDLGGIGKGYAIDLAFNELKTICSNFLIDGGGDIRVRGVNEKGELWKVGLRDREKVHGYLELNNQSLASSGSWARKVKQFHHLINPKTGKPVDQKFNTVFVLADDATTADAWATALFVLGKETEESKRAGVKVMFA